MELGVTGVTCPAGQGGLFFTQRLKLLQLTLPAIYFGFQIVDSLLGLLKLLIFFFQLLHEAL